ncbi:MAG TPA: glycoside hydrolase family 19 protein [Noviherbaspirillum sp.]
MDAIQLAYVLQAPIPRCVPWAPLLEDVFNLYDVSTPQRQACFIAQVGHESGRLRYMREIWGPTKQQLRYDPVTRLSKMLGNTQPGHGRMYMGRGAIQTTGLANYARVTQRLRRRFSKCPDFVREPQLLERPFWAAMSAGDYWEMRNLNKFADAYDFAELTRRINGGYHGLADRQAIYARAYPSLAL